MPMWIPVSFAEMSPLLVWRFGPICFRRSYVICLGQKLFLIILMHLPYLSVKSSKPTKCTLVDVNDYIPPEWVRFRTCQVASRHCLSLFIKNISDEEVRGEGEVGNSYGRRVMCTVATESWGKVLGIQDGSGHFGRSLKSCGWLRHWSITNISHANYMLPWDVGIVMFLRSCVVEKEKGSLHL